MRPSFCAAALAFLLAGCQALELEHKTVHLAGTLPDIYSQEVLDNLALLAAKPGSLPYFSVMQVGNAAIQHQFTAITNLTWDYTFIAALGKFIQHFDKKQLTLEPAEQDTVYWNPLPVRNPGQLDLIRCALETALGQTPCADCSTKLCNYFAGNPARYAAMQPGWVASGKKHDVPKGACWVAHCGKCYVWVIPGSEPTFIEFALGILDIATAVNVAELANPALVQGKARIDEAALLADFLSKTDVTVFDKDQRRRLEERLVADIEKGLPPLQPKPTIIKELFSPLMIPYGLPDKITIPPPEPSPPQQPTPPPPRKPYFMSPLLIYPSIGSEMR